MRYNVFQNRIGNWIIEDTIGDKYLINTPKFIGFEDKESAEIICKELNQLYNENQNIKEAYDELFKETIILINKIEKM